jgi:hypothetical protein
MGVMANSSTPMASVSADGSATFAGIVGVGNYTSDAGDTNYVRIYNGGGIRIGRSSGTNAQSFTIVDGPGNVASNTKVSMSSDGSATFGNLPVTFSFTSGYSGGINLSKDGYSKFNVDATGNLTSNGSAVFADTIDVNSNSLLQDGARIVAHGVIQVRKDAAGLNRCIEVYKGGNLLSNITANINNDGSAVFAGAVQSIFYGVGVNNVGNGVQNEAFAVSSAPNAQTAQTRKVTIYTDGSATFAGDLSVTSASTDYKIRATNTAAGGGGLYINNTSSNNNNILIRADAGLAANQVLTIYASGSATFAGNITAGNVSDIKFKENIEAAPAQLADIEAFELKTFDWKDEAPLSDELKAQRKLGLIAQEVEAICPEMVYEVADQDDDSYKAINHDVLIMKLLGAVKELAAEVAALKAS